VKEWATGTALELAVFRITVCVVVLFSVDVHEAAQWVERAQTAPAGWGFVSTVVPASHALARACWAVLMVTTALTLIGLWTRAVSVIAALCLVWLLGIPQLSGQVLHTHHLAWFLALVAVGPAGDALSVDAWRRGTPPTASVAHGLPLRVAWVSIGLIFFFPGVLKLLDRPAWWAGETLARQIAWKWFEFGGTPALTISPGWLPLCGIAVVVFELTLLPLVLFERTRLVGLAGALLFHAAVRLVMGISFSSLWACYVVFIPWTRWLGLDTPRTSSSSRAAVGAPLTLGAMLVGAQLVTGVLGLEQAWPVACYPTFRGQPPALVEWLEIEDTLADGTTRQVLSLENLRAADGQRWWGLAWRALEDHTKLHPLADARRARPEGAVTTFRRCSVRGCESIAGE
jgi:hypothetical protein